ncbi:MAG: hypothetical protein AAGF59_16135 [Pseudomonadota bacterium]
MDLVEYVPGHIWTTPYPVHYAGCDSTARMTVVKLDDHRIMLHSPCEIDEDDKRALAALGEVACIVAPGSFHYFHIASAQCAYPAAETYICPGVERKRPDLEFDWFLGDRPPKAWDGIMDQVLVRGSRFISEIAFLHRASKTLLLVDLIENIGDQTPDVGWQLKLWWKAVFHMWNQAKPAPEYQLGWHDKAAARKSLEKILKWDFERIIIAHGDTIEVNAKDIARKAWQVPLSGC